VFDNEARQGWKGIQPPPWANCMIGANGFCSSSLICQRTVTPISQSTKRESDGSSYCFSGSSQHYSILVYGISKEESQQFFFAD